MKILQFFSFTSITRAFTNELGPEYIGPTHKYDSSEGCEYLDENLHMQEDAFDDTEFENY
ncbi:hypothetical protein HUK80_05590 [Flavobacterium sp. MAH-1]|uniref:Uncharacterized protein n=1 Tax=Flavobacterium agri TaxID=2743471 RepID=A0A7Y9C5H1_9FLAO|nr:hypothetical protein [Flavobacterium agri]NUY80359.1 hypothetical protein [Flavobacterium agri]NYA70384.1 hypothetical protein [Flavobacterium agri]